MMDSRLEILSEMGFRRDPFPTAQMETADSVRVKRIVHMAVDSKAMLSIVADRGAGKTNALQNAFRDLDVKEVTLQTNEKEWLSIGDIERALILELSQENVARSREIRARQLRRILGEASRIRPVVLILEEAHRLHGQTLRSLKTMREMNWMGVSPLFTVIMAGQYDPMRKRGVDEVRLRSDTIFMKGLTSSEIRTYVEGTVAKCFDDDAIEAVLRLSNARNFLELQEVLINLMSKAIQVGQKKVTALEVFDVYGGGMKEILKKHNIGLPELEKETGISKPTLSMVLNERQGTISDEKFSETRAAIAEVLRRKTAGVKGQEAGEPGLRAVS